MSNAFVTLQRMLAPPPVLLGTVIEHHAADDTSTVELPDFIGRVAHDAGIATGSRIRVRGRTVPVGQRVFVRAGVMETQGPSGGILAIVIGTVAEVPAAMAFSGPVPNQTWGIGTPVLFSVAAYFSSPFGPLSYAVTTGALPAGLALDPDTGVISGARTDALAASVAITATDAELRTATTNSFTV